MRRHISTSLEIQIQRNRHRRKQLRHTRHNHRLRNSKRRIHNRKKQHTNRIRRRKRNNNTNTTGHVTYAFKPDSSWNVTKQSWLGYTSTADTCYKLNSSQEYNVTTLSNAPQIVNKTVSPTTGGWGDRREFNITIYDSQNNATVY